MQGGSGRAAVAGQQGGSSGRAAVAGQQCGRAAVSGRAVFLRLLRSLQQYNAVTAPSQRGHCTFNTSQRGYNTTRSQHNTVHHTTRLQHNAVTTRLKHGYNGHNAVTTQFQRGHNAVTTWLQQVSCAMQLQRGHNRAAVTAAFKQDSHIIKLLLAYISSFSTSS